MVRVPNSPTATAPSQPSRRSASSGASRPGQRAARTAAAPARPSAPGRQNVQAGQDPRGPINGYVATRSLTGTKTNTPLMEIPQSISVIGREEIRDQNPGNFAEALRYAPGVSAQTFGADTRNDWFKIRGFDAQDVGLFLDGLQLSSFAFATWKFPPFGIERIDILRGPSAVLYGGSGPGGLVNIISKTPPLTPLNYVETGVNSFGNAYLSFDFGGPVATSTGPSNELFYRLLGTVKGGDTQTAFTPDNNYFVAPSVTYKPDIDTTLTILASASRNDTRVQNFLPYVGTVVNAPFGRIPTGLFASDPSVDSFRREQEMIGYQFEKNLTDDLTFRQNARFAHDDVQFQTLLGNGYAGNPASALLSRFNDFAHDSANQADLDSSLEYRFATGLVQHKALVGVDLKSYEISDLQAFDFATPALNLLNPVYGVPQGFPSTVFADQTITQKQAGLYAQDQLKLGRLTLVLSGRNDWVNTYDNNRLLPSESRDDSKFSGRAGLIYNTDLGIAPYISYATSYNPIIGTNATTGQLFLPETGVQTEAGVKIEPAGFDGYFGASVFDLKRQNVLTTDPNNALQSIQTGEVTSRGIELEAVANVMPGLKVTGAFTNFNIFVSKDLNPALIGTVPTNTPSEIASLWGDYTFQTGQLAGFGFGAGVRYNGISYADTANSLVVPAYVLGDLAVHYEVNNWRFALNVTNITDKIYVGSCQTATACFYGDRRRAVASVSYKW
ncbi:iron complex outermembrane recepter protein [Bradyrhizobium canariense]|uniref:Iron complex outermembrane recepter protein n=1 Tax=Bradyrhizobium canariense TaxID=255045 RepID=A0A1H1QJL7_9BRAD|nr:iron complex outermembrane recepter protein [Bradyrhizobium canariense]